MVASTSLFEYSALLCGMLSVISAVGPSEGKNYTWVKEIEFDFRSSNEAVPILIDPKKVVICSVDLDSEHFKGDSKYSLENSFDGNLCSHLVYNRYNVNKMFNITLNKKNQVTLRETPNLITKYPHLKIIMEISLDDAELDQQVWIDFLRQLLSSRQKRQELICNIKNLQKQYGIHGIHFDVTFFYYPAEIAEFKVLANEFRDAFSESENFILSIDVDLAHRKKMLVYYNAITEISRIFDFVAVRAYNFYSHSGNRFSSVNGAPLYSSVADDENIYDNLQYLISTMRINPKKVILQIPFIGKTYSLILAVNTSGLYEETSEIHFIGPFGNEERLGYWGYNEICSDVLYNVNSNWKMYWDEKAMTPIIKDGTRWITFENPRSVIEKVKLTQQLGLGGTFSAFTDSDDFHGRCTNVTYPLLRSINLVNENLNQSLVCSMYKKENTKDPKTLISCNFYVKRVRINDTVKIECTIEGYTEAKINWMKVMHDNVEIINNATLELPNTGKYCSLSWKAVSKLELFIDSKKSIGKYVIAATNVKSPANSSIFITLQNHPYSVSDDNIWIEETNLEFPLVNKSAISALAYKLYKTDPVVFCNMDLRKPRENVNEISDNEFEFFLKTFNGNLCTHIVFSEALMDNHFKITNDPQFELQMSTAGKTLRKKYSHLKLMLEISSKNIIENSTEDSFSYYSEGVYSMLLADIKIYLKKFHLNGVILQQFYYFQAGEFAFKIFSKDLCKSFHRNGFIIGMEADISDRNVFVNLRLPTSTFVKSTEDTDEFDFISVKAFGLSQPESNITEHNSPLASEFNKNTIEADLKYIIDDLHVNASQLILQIPFFGFSYTLEDPSAYPFGLNSLTNSTPRNKMDYKDICLTLSRNKKDDWKMFWDNKAKVPFLKNGKQWISFDNSRSIYEKMIIVAKSRLKGVMVKSVNYDDIFGICSKNISFPLLRTVELGIKQTIVTKQQTSNTTSGYIIAAVTIMLLVTLSIALIRRQKNQTGLSGQEIKNFREGNSEFSTEYEDIAHVVSQPYDESFEIPSNRYQIDHSKILGSGRFGIVFMGSIKDSHDNVAAKSVKPGSSNEYLNSLLSELKIMIYLGKHPNIIGLVGACTTKLHKGIAYIFVEYSPIGNLQGYLRKSRDNFFPLMSIYNNVESVQRKSGLLSTSDLLIWSYQIASGLQHLSIKQIIHGDLATRNILLFENNVVKISDFGLSRKLYDYNYVKKSSEPVPWRWMAIESLKDMTFSVHSDMWSFGVTLWEIFSLAETPYPGLEWTVDFVDKLKRDLRLPKPIHANSSLYDFMVECWREAPKDRPTAENAVTWFYKFAQQENTTEQDCYTIIQDSIDAVAVDMSEDHVSPYC